MGQLSSNVVFVRVIAVFSGRILVVKCARGDPRRFLCNLRFLPPQFIATSDHRFPLLLLSRRNRWHRRAWRLRLQNSIVGSRLFAQFSARSRMATTAGGAWIARINTNLRILVRHRLEHLAIRPYLVIIVTKNRWWLQRTLRWSFLTRWTVSKFPYYSLAYRGLLKAF